jgi:hypothetical protein
MLTLLVNSTILLSQEKSIEGAKKDAPLVSQMGHHFKSILLLSRLSVAAAIMDKEWWEDSGNYAYIDSHMINHSALTESKERIAEVREAFKKNQLTNITIELYEPPSNRRKPNVFVCCENIDALSREFFADRTDLSRANKDQKEDTVPHSSEDVTKKQFCSEIISIPANRYKSDTIGGNGFACIARISWEFTSFEGNKVSRDIYSLLLKKNNEMWTAQPDESK